MTKAPQRRRFPVARSGRSKEATSETLYFSGRETAEVEELERRLKRLGIAKALLLVCFQWIVLITVLWFIIWGDQFGWWDRFGGMVGGGERTIPPKEFHWGL
jgi:hypothetical protein